MGVTEVRLLIAESGKTFLFGSNLLELSKEVLEKFVEENNEFVLDHRSDGGVNLIYVWRVEHRKELKARESIEREVAGFVASLAQGTQKDFSMGFSENKGD